MTFEYDNMYEESEGTPLFHNQDVFELENDNNDIKFVDRMRFKEEDFNFDLFGFIFDFLDPKDTIWKKFIKKDFIITDEEPLSCREQYIRHICVPPVVWDIDFTKLHTSNAPAMNIDLVDDRTIDVTYSSCYNKIYTNSFNKGIIKLCMHVTTTSNVHQHIGIVNEKFKFDTCLCLQESNAWYVSQTHQGFVNGNQTQLTIQYTPVETPRNQMILDLNKKTFTFQDVTVPIFGESFRFVVGSCGCVPTSYQIKGYDQ